MKRDAGLWALLGAVGLLWLYSRTGQGAANIGAAVDSAASLPARITSSVRGVRNNNPGNIRKSGDAWQGLSAQQTDPAFFQFDSMEYGVRALCRILRNYGAKYGLSTVRQIVSRWAPSIENNTGAYITAVCEYIGASPDAALDLSDRETLFLLARGIIKQEVGTIPAMLISDDTVLAGVSLALE